MSQVIQGCPHNCVATLSYNEELYVSCPEMLRLNPGKKQFRADMCRSCHIRKKDETNGS